MSKPSQRKRSRLIPLLCLVLLVGFWLIYRVMNTSFVPPVQPDPNGYDDLLQAASMLDKRTSNYDEMTLEELTKVVTQNRPALKLAREALIKECMVPVDWSAGETGLDTHMELGSSLRGLARAFMAAARYANSQDQMDEAVRCGLDMAELAPLIAKGGIMIDRQMAGGVYYGAMYSLSEQVHKLSRDDCLRLQKMLQDLHLQLEPPQEVIERDIAFVRGVHGRFQMLMMIGMVRAQSKQALELMEVTESRIKTLNHLLQTHLAIRAYQFDQSQLPESLGDLVPNYLDDVPLDSFSGKPLIYRQQEVGYLLYSVGANLKDDDGVETSRHGQGDLLLEVGN